MKPLISALAAALTATAALGLAACTPPAEPPASAPGAGEAAGPVGPAAPGVPYAPAEALLAADSVTFPNPGGRGTGLNIALGQPRAEVIAALTQFRGAEPNMSGNSECGAGPMIFADWGDGLQFHFQDGALVGWSAARNTPRAFATLTGIGVGSPLIDLRTAHPGIKVEVTTLGAEFEADGVHGLASGTGPVDRVTVLWGGVSCYFR